MFCTLPYISKCILLSLSSLRVGRWLTCATVSVFTGTGLNHLEQVFIVWLILYFLSAALHFSAPLVLQPQTRQAFSFMTTSSLPFLFAARKPSPHQCQTEVQTHQWGLKVEFKHVSQAEGVGWCVKSQTKAVDPPHWEGDTEANESGVWISTVCSTF